MDRVFTVLFVVTTVASAICALTPTPDPNTWWGRAYRAIEVLAGIVGKAKDDGLIKVDPKVVDLFTKKG